MRDLLLVLGLVFGWIVLSRWVLPWLGVPTCMSGCCEGTWCASGPASTDSAREDSASPVDTAEVLPPEDLLGNTPVEGADFARPPAASE